MSHATRLNLAIVLSLAAIAFNVYTIYTVWSHPEPKVAYTHVCPSGWKETQKQDGKIDCWREIQLQAAPPSAPARLSIHEPDWLTHDDWTRVPLAEYSSEPGARPRRTIPCLRVDIDRVAREQGWLAPGEPLPSEQLAREAPHMGCVPQHPDWVQLPPPPARSAR